MAVLDYLKTNRKAMLEKEKEVMCEFAANYATGCDSGTIITADQSFSETFNTKEK